MPHRTFIVRQIARSRQQALVFVLCVALSLASLVALGGFSQSVERSLQRDARSLHAADILVRSAYPLSAPLLDRLDELERQQRIDSARVYEFYSVVRRGDDSASLLAGLKVVARGYPFYGQVQLRSGRPFGQVLQPGSVIAQQGLLDRLGLSVGDWLAVGSARLRLADVVVKEPDQPVSFFSLGPRLFIHAEDLAGLDLIHTGSRVHHRALVRVAAGQNLADIAQRLRQTADPRQEKVDTYLSAGSRIKRFFDNFLFFLTLVGLLTLLLAGIGIQSTLTAVLRENTATIAVMKTLGAGSRLILGHFLAIVLIMGAAGTLLGLLAGLGLQWLLPVLLGRYFYPDVRMIVAWPAVAEGLLLGIVVVALFTLPPLARLQQLKPIAIFRKAEVRTRGGWASAAAAVALGLFFTAMILWQIREIGTGLAFTAALGGLIVFSAAVTRLVLGGIRKLRPSRLVLQQALRGLLRPGNATGAIVTTLAAALAALLALYLTEANLDASFVRSYPPDAPNLFFVNLQPDQRQAVAALLPQTPRFYPVVRARLTAIDGKAVDPRAERRRRGDNLARPFNLTHRADLLEDERLVRGAGLFRGDWNDIQVSVLDTVLEMAPIRVGDRLAFNIQGVPLEARVSSIRTRVKDSLKPFFYFVFQPRALQQAPQSIFAALRVPADRVAGLQQAVVAKFPNVSVIDVSQTITRFAEVLGRFSSIVRLFTALSLAAGVLIIAGSIFATRYARTREAVYFKILGARGRFILAVLTLENLTIGLISSLLAVGMAQTAAWLICSRVFEIEFEPFLGSVGLWVLGTLMVVVGVGLVSSISILRQRPAPFLARQPD